MNDTLNLNISIHITVSESPKLFEQTKSQRLLSKNVSYDYFDIDNHGDSLYMNHLKKQLNSADKILCVIEIESKKAALGPVLSLLQAISINPSSTLIICGTHPMIERLTRVVKRLKNCTEESLITELELYLNSN